MRKLLNLTPERRLEVAREIEAKLAGMPVTVITGRFERQHRTTGYLQQLVYVSSVGWTVLIRCRQGYVWSVPASPGSGGSPKSDVRQKAFKLTEIVDIVEGWAEKEDDDG